MDSRAIEDEMWRQARELVDGGGLRIEGLGTFEGQRFTPAGPPPPTGYDAAKLVVGVADKAGVKDDEVRALLKAAVKQALASAAGRPAPLGRLGLVEQGGRGLRWWRWRRAGTAPAAAVDGILAAWRAPGDDLAERVAAVTEAMAAIPGALSPADQARILDELDYDLDDADWQRFGDRIADALPY